MYPIKASNISYEDDSIVTKIYYFNLMVSYLYSFNPFIRINEIGKYLSHSMESREPWRTNIRIKGSGTKPFILILDSILVYATLIMWMNLSPYPNLRKSTLRILQKDFYSVFFDSSVKSKIAERVCSVYLFCF